MKSRYCHPVSYLICRILPVVFCLSITGACSHAPEPTAAAETIRPASDDFPLPAGLEPQVVFWRAVYAHWSQRQVVLHDDRHLDLIYSVIELPGAVGDIYTKDHRAYVKVQKQALQRQLQMLEQKLAAGQPLLAHEQRLADLISAVAGPGAIAGAADRLRSQRGLKERFKRGLELSGQYLPRFRSTFMQAGLPADLAFLPHVESSFRPLAQSSAGAVGMWQFTRGAAKVFMKVDAAVDERLDPFASARGAARYLGQAHELLDDWALALTSYNHGIASMRQAKERFGTDFMRIVAEYDRPSFGFASRNFYAEFLAAREIALAPERFFPEEIQYHEPVTHDSIILTQANNISNLSVYYGVDEGVLAGLNPAWKRAALTGRAALPQGIEIWLPSGTLAYLDKRRSSTRFELSMLPSEPLLSD
jgi:membrane-bound lytic murein transglycosylase D